MKLLFLSPQIEGIKFKNNRFLYDDDSPFAVFYRVASTYLDSIGANPAEKITDIMTLWSVNCDETSVRYYLDYLIIGDSAMSNKKEGYSFDMLEFEFII